MASSDDESEALPNNVSDYEFLCDDNEPISFAELPLAWNKGETHGGNPQLIFLSGKTDNGLRKFYKRVTAWKFDLSYKPEISVLSEEGSWIKLLNPRKAFQDIIRTIHITVNFLHFIRWNPQRPKKALWDHLNKIFSMFEKRPSLDDLGDHLDLIDEAVKRDETLANSKLLITCLEERSTKRTFNEDVNPSFIVDDDVVNENEVQEESDNIDGNGDDEADEDDCFDSVCAICDNGGDVLLCDGKCMRSFHATEEHGEDSQCETLGFTEEEYKAIEGVPFYCKNCEYKQHQCFACGKLGSSDESSGCEVFCCVNGACGFFYHPSCVAQLLHPGDNVAAEEHQQRIAAGEQFACPAHKCHICEEVEVRSDPELKFAVCRRCPRAYHVKCLPRRIKFEEDVDEESGIQPRAWKLGKRVIIYCLNHKIDPAISTPDRDHIKFPGPKQKKMQKPPLETSKKKALRRERSSSLEDHEGKRYSAKPPKWVDKVSSSSKQGDISKRLERFPAEGPSKKPKGITNTNSVEKLKKSKADERELSLGKKLYSRFCSMDSEPVQHSSEGNLHGEHEVVQKVKPPAKRNNDSITLDADTRKRILTLMKVASSSATLDQVKKKHKSPSTHAQSSKYYVDNITLGKVEGSVKAVRAALKKLDEGGSVLDAKAVCGNELLVQVLRWKDRLKVYLAPFLYGMRYTSFGRHFTKMDKLKEVVDMLHWYVQDGDTLVDFCCGSNDFSCLMKKKLDEMGKRCSFKNYDILQAKNDFSFERRDWMHVEPAELSDGSQLIMGLNPPFGVNASLANKFIDKALKFKPKLLILIVPRETQRLDEKESPYDLIWEDDQMFVGKSFYLPGSVDVNDKQIEDWNVSAPILYLWSCPDWTPKHKAIAVQHGHSSLAQKKYKMLESSNEMHVQALHPDKPEEGKQEDRATTRALHPDKPEEGEQEDRATKRALHPDKPEDGKQEERATTRALHPDKTENRKQEDKGTVSHHEGLPCDSRGNEGDKIYAQGKNDSEANSKKIGSKGKRKRQSNMSPENKSSSKGPASRHLSPHVAEHSTFEAYSPKPFETPSLLHSGRDDHHQFNRNNLSTYQPYSQAGYNSRNQDADDLVRKYTLSGDDPVMTSRQAYCPSPNPDYSFRGPTNRYLGEMIEYGRDINVQPHVNVYGREEPYSWSQRTVSPPYHGPGFPPPYGQLNPAGLSSFSEMNTSAMQRYAPRLDELNHGRMSNMVSGPPAPPDTRGIYHPPPPRPGPLGFAPGPYRPYSHQSSSGWLNE